MRFRVETSLEGFLERWVEYTGDYDDFVPAPHLWQAMLHSAGLSHDNKRAFGLTRQQAFEEMRDIMPGIPRQHKRYYRIEPRPAFAPYGYPVNSYNRIILSEYAIGALKFPLKVHRRGKRMESIRLPHKIGANG